MNEKIKCKGLAILLILAVGVILLQNFAPSTDEEKFLDSLGITGNFKLIKVLPETLEASIKTLESEMLTEKIDSGAIIVESTDKSPEVVVIHTANESTKEITPLFFINSK